MVKTIKKSFTMIELIFVIIILSLIATGSFKAIQMLYMRYYQVNTITKFSITSQVLLDETSEILYYRTPITAIGYSPSDGDFVKLSDVNDSKYKIFEWISEGFDAKDHIGEDISTGYSGFIDLDSSNKNTLTLVAKDFNISDTNQTLNQVFNNNFDLNETVAIIFAGTFDNGDESADIDYKNSFGWHGYDHNKTYTIKSLKQVGADANLTMNDEIKNNRVFSKFYLADTGWSIARGEDIKQDSNCLSQFKMEQNSLEFNNTLFIFYNYRPWKKESFCADPHNNNGENNEGNVSILAKNITSFRVKAVGDHIELKVQFSKPLYRGSDRNITITKQKVTF